MSETPNQFAIRANEEQIEVMERAEQACKILREISLEKPVEMQFRTDNIGENSPRQTIAELQIYVSSKLDTLYARRIRLQKGQAV